MGIQDSHKRVYHDGIRETFTEVRQIYWILGGRQQGKEVLKQFFIYKRLEGLPFRYNCTPVMAQVRKESSFSLFLRN